MRLKIVNKLYRELFLGHGMLLRTKLSRKINIDSMGQNQIDNIVQQFNHRPMKCLGFQTPNDVFKQTFGLLPV